MRALVEADHWQRGLGDAGRISPMFSLGVIGVTVIRDRSGADIHLAPRERAVLSRLVVAHPEEVTAEQLITCLWGLGPPATARKTLQNYVRRIRRGCVDGIISTTARGYRLGPAGRSQVEEGLAALTALQSAAATHAAGLVAGVEALWPPGEPLADLRDTVDLEPLRARLRILRAEALLACARVRLSSDQPRQAGELAGRVLDDDPYLASGWMLLLRSLLARDRRADVTAAYLQAHRLLAEIGQLPEPDLTALHRQSLGGADTPLGRTG